MNKSSSAASRMRSRERLAGAMPDVAVDAQQDGFLAGRAGGRGLQRGRELARMQRVHAAVVLAGRHQHGRDTRCRARRGGTANTP